MRYAWLGCLCFGSLLLAGTTDSETNVNTQYTVETVRVDAGSWQTDAVADRDQRLSSGLRKEFAALVGEKLNPTRLEELAGRLRRELHARTVEHRVLRGKSPEYVQVVFDVRTNPARFDVSVPKFLYQDRQGWSGAIEGTATLHNNGFTLGLVSDGDELVERYTGIEARYQAAHLADGRLGFTFEFDTYHDQWDKTAIETEDPADLYRTRENFQPMVTFAPVKPLSVSFGASFEQLEEPDGQIRAANAVVAGVRYHRQVEGDFEQNLEADYALRAASSELASDFAYSRHHWKLHYAVSRGKQTLSDDLTAGMIFGQAPLFERFVLGNSSTLRGWDRYLIDPLGGNRMVHNSVEYRYGVLQVFYDSGAIWNSGESVIARNSVGVGLRQGCFSVAMAFPLRDGRVEPIFMIGMNY